MTEPVRFPEMVTLGSWQDAFHGKLELLFIHSTSSDSLSQFILKLANQWFDAAQPRWLSVFAPMGYQPFRPLLQIIFQYLSEHSLSASELLDCCDIYPPHKALIAGFLSGSEPQRPEPLLYDEYEFERQQLCSSIINLLCYISQQQPILAVIDQFHLADISSWRLIQAMADCSDYGRILLIIGLNKYHHIDEDDELNETWLSFLSKAKEQHTLLDLDNDAVISPSPATDSSGVLSITSTESLKYAQTALAFLATEEAYYHAQQAYRTSQMALSLDDPYSLKLHAEICLSLGDSNYLLKQNDSALFNYQEALDVYQSAKDSTGIATTCYRLALAYLRKHDLDTAERFAQQAISHALNSDNLLLEFNAIFTLYLIADKTTSTIEIPLYQRLLFLIDRLSLTNAKIFCLKNSYIYLSYYKTSSAVLDCCDQAIQLANKLNNKLALASILHKKAIIYGFNDDRSAALESLLHSYQLRLELKDQIELIRICNGIGYFFTLTEDYQQAQEYFNQAANNLAGIRDYNEITVTLYNMASVYFQTHEFYLALKFLDKVLQIMNILHMNHIPFRPMANIVALKGLCHLKLAEHSKSFECVSKLARLDAGNSTETLALIQVFYAQVSALAANWTQADAHMTTATQLLTSQVKSHRPLLLQLYLEWAFIKQAAHQQAQAQLHFATSLALCEELNFNLHAHWIRQLQSGIAASPQFPLLKHYQFDLDSILNAAKQQVTLNKLQKVIREVKCLNSLQSLLVRGGNKTTIARELVHLIQNFLPINYLFLHAKTGNDWSILASKDNTDDADGQWWSLIQQIASQGPSIMLNRLSHKAYLSQLNRPLSSVINLRMARGEQLLFNLFVATDQEHWTFESGDLRFLSIAFSQTITVFEKIAYEENLIRLSTTDSLSGLANRDALQTRLKQEVNRLERYQFRHSSRLSVAFFDLDNFKFYNDHFGHEVGDLIIQAFGKLLHQVLRDVDFVSRYGGDEFVVLLPETDAAQAVIATQRILKMLEEQQQFRPEIERHLGYSIEIATKNQLTCSIGIAVYDFTEALPENMSLLLARADEALYMAKNKGKNRVEVWTGYPHPQTKAALVATQVNR